MATYLPWFILRDTPMVGCQLYNRLIRHFKTPEAVLGAKASQLAAVKGISRKAIANIQHPGPWAAAAETEIRLLLDTGCGVMTLNDPAYPHLLKQIPDPPPILTFLGIPDPDAPCIAIVGSRNATSYGLNTARYLGRRLAENGFCIVSGLARGIDTAAHQGALDVGGKTIAVLGSGLKKIYPKENRDLFYRIRESGALFSEFKLDTDPYPYNFPVRNRVIAGLSTGTIVVEAERKSGSLITARLAAEYNREVFAIPGSIKSRKSQGTHALLKQGAKLVENETDVMDELIQFVHVKTAESKTEKQAPLGDANKQVIVNLLDPYPKHIDRIILESRMKSGAVSALLLELELAGRVTYHPGNFYSTLEA